MLELFVQYKDSKPQNDDSDMTFDIQIHFTYLLGGQPYFMLRNVNLKYEYNSIFQSEDFDSTVL